jgi:hypothetical protein
MQCPSCGREWGVGKLPHLCWWCRSQMRQTDQEGVVITPQEQLELNLEHKKPEGENK